MTTDVHYENFKLGRPHIPQHSPMLLEKGAHARSVCQEHNAMPVREADRRKALLKDLFGTTAGDDFYITQPFFCDYGFNIHLGKNVYMNTDCCILDCAKVTIGDDTMFGPKVQIYAVSHSTDPTERATLLETARPVTIGRNCWIGGSAIICDGVTIGDCVTVGAGSVVTRDLPSNVVAVGSPARIVKSVKPIEYKSPTP